MAMFKRAILFFLLTMALMPSAFAQRTRLKPGMNIFSTQQDVEMGLQASQEAAKALPMLNNQRVDDYLNRLGKKLASYAPGEKYPYQFRCVNDSTINAFALPGGFLFINRGVIEMSDSEVELAGVIGHEIAHVALRHGTNQATKQYAAQMPLALLGSLTGSNSLGGLVAQLGSSFAANSILLKYSRDAERQADLMGAQILFDAGYDPRPMMNFFRKMEESGRGSDFFSTHPNPDNRIKNIETEIGRLGYASGGGMIDTGEFRGVKRLVRSLPAAPKAVSGGAQQPAGTERVQRPSRPSTRLKVYSGEIVSLRHPDNWKPYEEDNSLTLAPENGLIGGDNSALAYGVILSTFVPPYREGPSSLKTATDQLIANLQNMNPDMRLSGRQSQVTVAGGRALSTTLTSNSPVGGREIDWLVTLERPEGLIYFVFVAPEQEFSSYQKAFQKVLDSARFK